MRPLKDLRGRVVDALVVGCGVLLALLPASPWNAPIAARDSGVFLYVGWRILSGETPYVDVWDHKPPVIFYLNALGLAISGGSPWGVWAVELLFLLGAAVVLHELVRRAFGRLPALFASCLWLLTLAFVIQGGNFTTEYALPLQLLCFLLAGQGEKRGPATWRSCYLLIGALTGIAFFTKQNTVGVGVAVVVYVVVSSLAARRGDRILPRLLPMLAGGLAVSALVVLLFAAQGALGALWDAAFVYNLAYASAPTASLGQCALGALLVLSRTGLALVGCLGWVAGVAVFALRRDVGRAATPLLAIALIDLPVELLSVGVPHHLYTHYFMALLPALAILSGYAFSILVGWLSTRSPSGRSAALVTLLVVALLSVAQIGPYVEMAWGSVENRHGRAIAFVRSATSEEDTVLMWGAETATNFFARRRSPTRFVYQYPLYTPGYADSAKAEELLADIRSHPPRLIVDTHNPRTPIRSFGATPAQREALLGLIGSRYRFAGTVDSWTVYERR